MILNLYDRSTTRRISLTPDAVHTAPWDASLLLAFSGYRSDLGPGDSERFALVDFKIIYADGFFMGTRTTVAPPQAIFRDVDHFTASLFKDYQEQFSAPGGDLRHELIHTIPDGIPGAGAILVRDSIQLRQNGVMRPKGGTLVGSERWKRDQERSALLTLGYKEVGA